MANRFPAFWCAVGEIDPKEGIIVPQPMSKCNKVVIRERLNGVTFVHGSGTVVHLPDRMHCGSTSFSCMAISPDLRSHNPALDWKPIKIKQRPATLFTETSCTRSSRPSPTLFMRSRGWLWLSSRDTTLRSSCLPSSYSNWLYSSRYMRSAAHHNHHRDIVREELAARSVAKQRPLPCERDRSSHNPKRRCLVQQKLNVICRHTGRKKIC